MVSSKTAKIKNVMKKQNVPSLPELVQVAVDGGEKIVACTMTMDLLGIDPSDLIDGTQFGGVATLLGEAAESQTTLFI